MHDSHEDQHGSINNPLILFEFVGTEQLNLTANVAKLEIKFPDLIIDIEQWEILNHSAYSNIWIQPKRKYVYQTKTPFNEIEIEGVQLMIQISKPQISNQNSNFEIFGFFNPKEWHGRNQLNLQPTGKIVITGMKKIISRQGNLNDPDFFNDLSVNQYCFIQKCVWLYFGNNARCA